MLGSLLQAALPGRLVTVLNLGVSAQDTRTHLATTCQHVTDLNVDACVFLIGTNDLGIATATAPPMTTPDNFYPAPRLSMAWKDLMRRTQLGRHAMQVRRAVRPARTTPYFAEDAAHQAALPIHDPPPAATAAGLAHYARNIVSLAGTCKEHGIAVLFATQPCMFSQPPQPAELAVYWGCHTGGRAVAAADFAALLARVNEHLRATCAAHGYPCVDLAAEVPRGLGWFYDQVHFNEAGARRVAEVLVEPVRRLLD